MNLQCTSIVVLAIAFRYQSESFSDDETKIIILRFDNDTLDTDTIKKCSGHT